MFDPLSIDAPYDSLTFLNNLTAYNNNVGNIELLDLMRAIQEADSYYWEGLVFPTAERTTVPGFGTVNGTMQIPQGTYVTGITHYDIVEEEARHALGWGFKLRLWD